MSSVGTPGQDGVRDTPGTLAPTTSGYADVNGLHLYHEEYGAAVDDDRTPLVLLHGGLMSIDLTFADLIPVLARRHRLVAVELQGHGRTADVDRVVSPANNAADVVALLDELGIAAAHVLGHSMGGAAAMELAVSYPDRVLSVVPVSITVRPEGMHADFSDPARMATSTRMPTADDASAMRATYVRLSPHPERFDDFLATLSASQQDLRGWSDEQLAGVRAPVLMVIGDHDFTTVEHAAVMLATIPGSQLLVLPGTTHMDAPRRVDLLDPAMAAFLA